MELFTAAKDLKFMDAHQIINEAVKIPAKSSQQKFFLILTLTLILPLSVIQLVSVLNFSSFLLIRISNIHDLFYILSLSLFSLLSTSATVFTVASIYANKPIYFIPTLFALPRIFEHLMMTYFYILLLMIMNFLTFCTIPVAALVWLSHNEDLIMGVMVIFAIVYVGVHFYVIAAWNLASVVSVVEPNVYGLAAMKKSKQLLRGRTRIALELVSIYYSATWIVDRVFQSAMQLHVHFMVKLLLGLLCLFVLVVVNLMGQLVQSVFFLACKSYHDQVVDRKVLYDHLGGYDLRDKSELEMQSLVQDHDTVGYQPVAPNAATDSINEQRSAIDHDTIGDQNVEMKEPIIYLDLV